MKYTDTEMLDWVISRGWVARVTKKRANQYQNDAFILCMNSRKNINRAMTDAVDTPRRSEKGRKKK